MKKQLISVLMLITIIGIFSYKIANSSNYIIDKRITTEYGDVFRITCTNYQHKWMISHESGFYNRLQVYNEMEGILPIHSNEKIRCYLVGNIIIYYDSETESFTRFNGDLYANSEMVPIVKKVLLKNNVILREYLPFFISEYEKDTKEMLRNLINNNYNELSEYGLSADEDIINSMKITAQQHLE